MGNRIVDCIMGSSVAGQIAVVMLTKEKETSNSFVQTVFWLFRVTRVKLGLIEG